MAEDKDYHQSYRGMSVKNLMLELVLFIAMIVIGILFYFSIYPPNKNRELSEDELRVILLRIQIENEWRKHD